MAGRVESERLAQVRPPGGESALLAVGAPDVGEELRPRRRRERVLVGQHRHRLGQPVAVGRDSVAGVALLNEDIVDGDESVVARESEAELPVFEARESLVEPADRLEGVAV